MSVKTLALETTENGNTTSLVDDHGRIWATGGSSHSLLREAGFAAQREGYESIMVGAQTWEVEKLVKLN